MYGIVYKITHRASGKVYVGQTVRTLKCRLRGHLRNDSYLGNALRKYGVDSFDISVLAEADSAAELNALEAESVKLSNSVWPNGYNMMEGGGSAGKRSALSCQRMKAAQAKWTESKRLRMLGNKNGVGVKHPELKKLTSSIAHQRKAARAAASSRRLNGYKPSDAFVNSSRMAGKHHSDESLLLQSQLRAKFWEDRSPRVQRKCGNCENAFEVRLGNKRSRQRLFCSRSCALIGNLCRAGLKHSLLSREKMSVSRKGKPRNYVMTDATRQRIREGVNRHNDKRRAA